ncbi:MAG: hypothetical protein ACETWR_08380 [Anaerolineae bacterium]
MEQMAVRRTYHRRISLRPVVVGLIASLALLLFYLGLVSLISQSVSHALALLAEDRWFVFPITLGFGIQAGLFTYLRALHGATGMPAAVTGSSAGTSTAAMIACCAHHLTDVLPLVGLSGATIFLAQYKVPFMIVGLLSNAAGIGVLLAMIRRAKKQITHEGSCH